MRLWLVLPWPVVLSVCCGGCGQETVMLASSAADASVDSQPHDGSSPCVPGEAAACMPNGTKCTTQGACCSNRCESGYCLPSGACTSPETGCSARSTCCSGRCEPQGNSLVCASYCAADGSRCEGHQDCCSLDCHAGACGGAICKVAGSMCMGDEECCSSSCDNGSCTVDATTSCRASGEGCSGADAGTTCCSGVCNTTTNRCDLGPGACREPGTPCMVDADCCRGRCAVSAGGVPECTSQCLADGADCNSAGDCCSGTCTGIPSRCGGACPD